MANARSNGYRFQVSCKGNTIICVAQILADELQKQKKSVKGSVT